MNEKKIKDLLQNFKEGIITEAFVLDALKESDTLTGEGYHLDMHREMRTGFPEIVYCQSKAEDHLKGIFTAFADHQHNFIGTRMSTAQYEYLKGIDDRIIYYEKAKIGALIFSEPEKMEGNVSIFAAGTSDIDVAEEAYVTLKLFGAEPTKVYDVGVAGIHRLLSHSKTIIEADVIIAVAGMEGALPSVIGGLSDAPVIAVPTSVGYGTARNGETALFAMLNSCASGISVVNIDNGFGAAYTAAAILKKINKK